MDVLIDRQTLKKYDVAGPRYTSYPTAPQWTAQVGLLDYQNLLATFSQNQKTLSLYVHIPFCESLCYFCACNKVIRANEEKVGDEFLEYLFLELGLIENALGRHQKQIKQLHWGGGTPSYLSISQMTRLYRRIEEIFKIDHNEEIAIEVDPRTVNEEKLKALRDLGFNRISMGVQDFDPKVQDDINRVQSFDQVASLINYARILKYKSINVDLIYGLPYQTQVTFQRTIEKIITLRPDRIALYSFAYVPWISKPQNKFNLDAIPSSDDKLEIFLQSRKALMESGYMAIAMDHFALCEDEMAKAYQGNALHRNFMGYTVKPADEYIGVGPSAIGCLEGGYVQNTKVLPEYYASLKRGELPIERGKILTEDDIKRRWVIQELMCHFRIQYIDFEKRFAMSFEDYFKLEQQHLDECEQDHLIERSSHGIIATDLGRIFIRNICMGFDAYLRLTGQKQRFSRTI